MNTRTHRQRARTPASTIQRDVADLSTSALATIYGCCGIFDLCGDRDLMSLSFESSNPFLDWLGWERTDVCRIRKNFIAWVRDQHNGGVATAGYVGNPCADPNGVEYGTCDFTLEDFARLRRQGPVRDITKLSLRLCETQPRYRLDGTPITDDLEYDMRITTEVIMQDLKRMLINGNKTTAGQFDGLQRLVKTGYANADGVDCQLMDSIVVNWNSNDMDGGAGITWNGTAVAATFNFIDVLLAVYRRIRARIEMSPALSAQAMQPGDMVLVMPSAFIDCLLNAFTCWRVCPGVAFNESNLDSERARNYRDSLNGGMFGAGRIYLHGFEVPILPYDWGLINSATNFDAYLLTGQIGNVKLINGQYNDMAFAATKRAGRYNVTDGGRLLQYYQSDHTCEKIIEEMQPRLLMWAPWAQSRFQSISCATPLGPISPDPDSAFFSETSFSLANC